MQRKTERNPAPLRKRPLDADKPARFDGEGEIDIARSAVVSYSSERPTDPVEHMFDGSSGPGATCWLSARPDTTEQIVVEFDAPQAISRLVYEVEEPERERTQEVRVELSEDGGRTYRQILVQEYTFSPRGATFQRQDQRFERCRASQVRLTIVPNKNGSGTATLTALRLFT
jgi:F5/8 type C domain